jgi:sugar O-acyltransferase (sialic acid O-acetyltransferase NeuD family)
MEPILLIGGGGHCHSCIDVIEAGGRFSIHGIVDHNPVPGSNAFGFPILGSDEDLPELLSGCRSALVTVGQIRSPEIRIRLFSRLQALGASLPVIVSPLARLSPRADAGQGTIIVHGAVVNAGAVIGLNCIVNTMALVEHDVQVGSHCHISTGAIINGGTVVGDGSFIGSNAVIREGVHIGENSVVGAGCRVLHNLPRGTILKQIK